MSGALFSPCSLAWGQTRVGVGGNGDLLQKDLDQHAVAPRTVVVSATDPHSRPLSTPTSTGDSVTLTGKAGPVSCGVTASFSCVLLQQGFVVPYKGLFPQSCGHSVVKSHWPSKSDSLGFLSPFARSPGCEICCGL